MEVLMNNRWKVEKPFVFVIFGATGDLTKRKLIPAIYALAIDNLLPDNFYILAIGRRDYTSEIFQNLMEEAVKDYSQRDFEKEVWNGIKGRITYIKFDFSAPEGYLLLKKHLDIFSEKGIHNHLFFLAVAPNLFEPIIIELKKNNLLSEGNGWKRVMIEKPFGENLEKASELNNILTDALPEERIYRIDHYLGKEMIQNILTLRFSNSIFEPLWNRFHIDHVQISIPETVGIGSRGSYYDRTGVLKDMVQNHMFQLLAIIAMEPPVKLDAEHIRFEKIRVMRALRPFPDNLSDSEIVLGQYTEGIVDGKAVPGYLQEEKVDPNSRTPTFAALKLWIDNYRWQGVPFYLLTGKRLNRKNAEIAIQFKESPGVKLYSDYACAKPNILVFRIQPYEGFYFQLNAKKPGNYYEMMQANMDYCQTAEYGNNSPEAYERLIMEAIRGNNSLFTSWDELNVSWRYIEDLEMKLSRNSVPVYPYPAGSVGPEAAVKLMENDGRAWWNMDNSINFCTRRI
ncbi:glucose-6-phosphate 1-dehydrogenase Zwf [Thermoclostridium stercorarium subsp. stercorarium DSM 8532]|uniref:Glucose-6-phosphate 1-dehydrogenase n=5 Tax=Thermoclostridium stercorarium TaxID=1510 RepID=L7VNJ0_THES1|nr:glucose-6-phosphate 1-dehydrogenase Zwf [Thermoclostridium stercorarium subsp. stercorarium DSM 8532]ANW98591.1 glucose-6-phosphate dehydrogenase [Thermoclostridium stercorarium subsp. thermolacticum DSM 2910]ANX01133.1 glucose-6-phosphate dehydrogenase [Thermoclostridium stercorarium subsp. leptospartum DSM 9219]